MKFTTATAFIIATLAATTSAAALDPKLAARNAVGDATVNIESLPGTPVLSALLPRQSQTIDSKHQDRESAEAALDDNRAEGRRRLSGTTANCKTSACHSCMNAATLGSLAEVAGCGIIAAGAEVGTAGAGTPFVVAGFATCETAIVANMAKSVLECEAL